MHVRLFKMRLIIKNIFYPLILFNYRIKIKVSNLFRDKNNKIIYNPGYEKLWRWFGLSYASWITIPRVLAHNMPNKWQNKMTRLLEEYENYWDLDESNLNTEVTIKNDDGEIKIPDWINYRHTDS